MAFAKQGKRLIDFFLHALLWIITVTHFCFSKKLLLNASFLLIEITKSGKKNSPKQIIIQIDLTG